jgi:hypothetical protein
MARRSWGLGRSSLVSGSGDAEHEDAASSPCPSPIHRAGGLEPKDNRQAHDQRIDGRQHVGPRDDAPVRSCTAVACDSRLFTL